MFYSGTFILDCLFYALLSVLTVQFDNTIGVCE